MNIRSLRLDNFRNYERLSLNLSDGINFFSGPNAAGKTNLLEAVYLLATGRSLRAMKHGEMIRWGADWMYLKAIVEAKAGDLEIEVAVNQEGKSSKINGVNSKRIHELLGNLRVVFFSPDEIALVKGPPVVRRKYIDLQISQVSKAYYRFALLYYRLLGQKNAYLKDHNGSSVDSKLLDSWDEALASTGSQLMAARFKALQALAENSSRYVGEMTGDREKFHIAYVPSVNLNLQELLRDGQGGITRLQAELQAAIKESRSVELARRVSVVGPHRDDLRFELDGKDLRAYGSQGQQRTAVLALKLAEVDFISEATGDTPVLLLDDVFSELDETRRGLLLKVLSGKIQSMITSTDPLTNDAQTVFRKAACYTVGGGRVIPAAPW
ncbi:MAG TPA: DNA replication/repair protein RecF [Firmicutes bacterium]|nr:DNA replication/repair protein RecF [Bacillota bacterium]